MNVQPHFPLRRLVVRDAYPCAAQQLVNLQSLFYWYAIV